MASNLNQKRDELDRNWKKYLEAVDPVELRKRFRFYFKRAHNRIGQDFVRIARDSIISDQPYAPNAPLTIALKGSSKPLVDTGELIRSLGYKVKGHTKVTVGVGRSKQVGKRQLYEVLHNGARIKVTPQMARFMAIKLSKMLRDGNFKGRTKANRRDHKSRIEGSLEKMTNASKGKNLGWWVIPARPFLATPLGSDEFNEAVVRHYLEAFDLTLTKPIKGFQAEQAAARQAKRNAARLKKLSKLQRRIRIGGATG